MKKIWFMLLMICSVCAFSACSDDDDDKKDEENVEHLVMDGVVPSSVAAGDDVKITGKGFAETAQLALQNAKDNIDITATFTETEINFMLPYNFEPGDYKVILKQDGKTWEFKSTMTVTKPTRSLRIKEITLVQNGALSSTFNFKYNKDNKIINITKTIDDYPMSFDIDYATEHINITGYDEYRFDLNSNGNIINSYLPNDGDWDDDDNWVTIPANIAWTYDADGYLTEGGYYDYSYEFDENKNLSSVGYNAIYQYNNPTQKNNLYLVDPIALMTDFFYGEYTIDDLLPHLLGICGKRSSYLPTNAYPLYSNTPYEIVYANNDIYPEYISGIEFQYTETSYKIQFIYE